MRDDYGTESHGDKGRIRHGSPTFYRLLDEMAALHDRKSHDYASDQNPTGNYRFAGEMALVFKHSSMDAGFFGRIAEKIYRLANLESSSRTPKNETVEDTERDICVITALWMADRIDRRNRAGQQYKYLDSAGNEILPKEDKRLSETEQASQDACCKMIPLVEMMTEQDKRQMRDYLSACLRDESAQTGQGRANDTKRL